MFDKILSPFTTASTLGVATRYITVIIGASLIVAGAFGLLSPEQIETLNREIPTLVGAIAGLVTVATTVYAVATKARSDKADAAAKQIDEKLAPSASVKIETPADQPDIVVPGTKA